MICPRCGNKPLSFASFLVTLNPFRISCVGCGARLRAGPIAYVWAALHLLIAVALVRLDRGMVVAGMIGSLAGAGIFVTGALCLVFGTAYVIPRMLLASSARSAGVRSVASS